MRSPSGVDEEGMTPSLLLSRPSATHGEWMDVASAATYAGVALTVLWAAVREGELRSKAAYSNMPSALVHSHAVEAWAAERESRFVGLAG
jgi:hypothetical protein